ncbi:MAG: hypothetical protein PW845_04090 [Pseudomonas sp.]|uniref:hypothetical protein n=1 Tax=Pseudomonas abieticivorans TaxID=2931382 RepID=UPI0020C11D56|nr:hypothetical protein [Pseudomonas sp. PIA16]MDE1164564.1 hypothetical protein [Pseudomonas sp.]
MQYAAFSDEQIKTLVDSIDRDGYAVLPNWATPEQLAELKGLVTDSIASAGGNYVALSGRQAVTGTLLHEWGTSPVFIDLCKRVVNTATGRDSEETGLFQVLRCLTGSTGRRESMIFHYDSYVLTTIMPVCLPENGPKGDLLMIPNKRPVRSHYAWNLLDKVKVDNRWVQGWLAKRHQQKSKAFTQIAMNPGDMYFFWGYRSLHTNLPGDPNGVRATAVFHYDNVHGSSSLASRIRQVFKPAKPARSLARPQPR